MSRTFIVATEVALIIGALAAIYWLAGSPLSSSGSPAPTPGHQVLISDQGPRTPIEISLPGTTEAPSTPTPSVPQISVPDVDCGANVGGHVVDTGQVITYYGHPYTDRMGILGELSPDALVQQLRAHAQTYDDLNGELTARPAIHLVYATAQNHPGNDGKYLLYLDDETLQQYLDLACRENMLVFIDLQFGLADVLSEVERVLPFLAYPNVHLALDPEFAMQPGQVPGEAIGSLDAEEINAAQAAVQSLIEQHNLEDKIIVVHQFLDEMIARKELLQDYPRIKLVIDMDGFGSSEVKRVKYRWYARPAEHSGIKLFFKHDTPLMSESDVIRLEADVVIYQ
jgi:hypothetical protein